MRFQPRYRLLQLQLVVREIEFHAARGREDGRAVAGLQCAELPRGGVPDGFQIAEIPDRDIVEEVRDEARGKLDSRSACGLRHGSLGIRQRSVGGGLTPGALHRETGDLLPLSIVEELKVVFSEIAHDMAVAVANHYRDLNHGHSRLERLAGLYLGSRAGQRTDGQYE